MQAVKNDTTWDLIFPDIEANKEFYKLKWDGDIERWQNLGGTIKVYKTLKDIPAKAFITDTEYIHAIVKAIGEEHYKCKF